MKNVVGIIAFHFENESSKVYVSGIGVYLQWSMVVVGIKNSSIK